MNPYEDQNLISILKLHSITNIRGAPAYQVSNTLNKILPTEYIFKYNGTRTEYNTLH
jgi:hypothetical protein